MSQDEHLDGHGDHTCVPSVALPTESPDSTGGSQGKSLGVFAASVMERFWSKVDKRGPDECWEWSGARNVGGYGIFGVNGRCVIASRTVAALALGRELLPSPEEWALHRCDHPPCCNPSHIFVGTPQDNALDMLRKGRNGIGAKTRMGRIRAAVERGRDRHVNAILWRLSQLEHMRGDVEYHCDASAADILVACDAAPVDVEPEPMPDTDDVLDLAIVNAAIDRAMADLPFKVRAVVHLRRQNLTLEDIASRLGVTRQRIEQIEKIAIAKLQKHRAIAVIMRGKPFPAPVTRHAISSERARLINEKCAAFFAKRAPTSRVKRRAGADRADAWRRARLEREAARTRDVVDGFLSLQRRAA
jgi:RNA polymerase sigma factor (sigma-70 family)